MLGSDGSRELVPFSKSSNCKTVPPHAFAGVTMLDKETKDMELFIFIYLFGVLYRFQHCTGHITMGSFVGRGNK